jgi:hypothetical protein
VRVFGVDAEGVAKTRLRIDAPEGSIADLEAVERTRSWR